MAEEKEMAVPEKKELDSAKEKTRPGRFYVPNTDILETEEALLVIMDLPGVSKDRVEVNVEKNELSVEGYIDSSAYEDLMPVYTEYNVGHFARSFVLSNEIDRDGITAAMADGVLTLTLAKLKEAQPRRVTVA